MMSQTTSNTPHLFEDDLPESANTQRKIFAEWASSVQFKKPPVLFEEQEQADDFEIHESPEISQSFSQGIQLSSHSEHTPDRKQGYSLVQIPGPEHAPFRHSPGDAFIIPIKILDGSPSASGKPLREGKRLFMKATHEVKIGPKLRLLFILI
ncbi:hypothetical protein BDW68DRAFT_189305 [Aspergillus falconensis]